MSATDGSLLMGMHGLRAGGDIANAWSQAAAERAQGRYEASSHQTNARLAELYAADAIARGRTEGRDLSQSVRRLRGAQQAAYAGQGVDLSAGTPVEVLEDTDRLAREDLKRIENNAWRESLGFRTEAAQHRQSAELAKISSRFKAGTTLATGGMRAAREVLSGAYEVNAGKKKAATAGDGLGTLYEHRRPR
jgi:hypothetical protein